jgi:hypothetical protein
MAANAYLVAAEAPDPVPDPLPDPHYVTKKKITRYEIVA